MNEERPHSTYYKTLEDVKDYLRPGGVKYFILDAEPRLKERYISGSEEHILDRVYLWMAFFSITYLAAGRVSETIGLTMNDIYVFKENQVLYLRIKTANRKNKKKHSKIIVVSYSTKHDRVFIKKVTRWYKRLYKKYKFKEKTGYTWKQALLQQFKTDDDKTRMNNLLSNKYLFENGEENGEKQYSDRQAQLLCKDVLYCNSHFLRKLRASILIDKFNASPYQLKEYLGHTGIVSSDPYVSLRQSNIKELVANKDFI